MARKTQQTQNVETVEELIEALREMPPWTPLDNPKNVWRALPDRGDDDYSIDNPGVCVIV
jgi:hypothetical protein